MPALISGAGGNKGAKRTALIHLYYNIIKTVVFMAVFYAIDAFVHFEFMARGVKASCLQAAQDAINGASNVGSFTHFKSARSAVGGASIIIGNHVFY